MHVGIGPEHVVVGQDVGEAEVFHLLGVGAHRAHVGSDLGLGEDDADSHGPCLPGVCPGRSPPKPGAAPGVTQR